MYHKMAHYFKPHRVPYPLKMLRMGIHCIWLKDSQIRHRLLLRGPAVRQLVLIVTEV